MTNGVWFNGRLLTLSNGGTTDRILIADRDINGRSALWEQGASRYSRIYRDTFPGNREYTVEAQLLADTYAELSRLEESWASWHEWQTGRATLTRLTDNGHWYQASVVPKEPEFRRGPGFGCIVTQGYEFETPFWRTREERSATSAFNADTPVNVSCQNAGDVPAWVRMTLTGIVEDPKWAIGSNVVEFDLANTHANDLLEIRCQPPATAYKTPNGGAQASIYGYRTFETMFGLMQLPAKATTNVVLTAASGTPATSIYWYEWHNYLR